MYKFLWALGAYMMRKFDWRLAGYTCDCASEEWHTPLLTWVRSWDGGEFGRYIYLRRVLVWSSVMGDPRLDRA